jgi:hypothetical protein
LNASTRSTFVHLYFELSKKLASAPQWARRTAGILILIAGLLASLRVAPPQGSDFLSFYLMGKAIDTGANIYQSAPRKEICDLLGLESPAGMFYPPATGFVVAPFSALPYNIAKHAWFLVLNVAVILGVRALVRFLAPQAQSYIWMSAAGVVLLSACLRWGLMLSQVAPLVLGLLCFFFVALYSDRPRMAVAIALLATASKMTLAVPFLGMLLLRRRIFSTAIVGGGWVLLNVIGFLRLGEGSIGDYIANIEGVDSLTNGTNINMPSPWAGISLPRTDWTFLLYGLTGNYGVARLWSLVGGALLALYLLFLGIRTREPHSRLTGAAFLGPLICLGTVCVYHHQYDLCLFVVPILIAYFCAKVTPIPSLTLVLTAPLVVMLLALPIGALQGWLESRFGPVGFAFLKLSFPIAVTLALFGLLVDLRQRAAPRQYGVTPA